VEQLLLFLQQRNANKNKDKRRGSHVDMRRKMLDDEFSATGTGGPPARIAELEDYREMLYEDIGGGVMQGASKILQVRF
jgi:hypothetical protein